MESIERRVAWVAITAAIVFAFGTNGSFAYGIGAIGTWELIVYVGGLVCLAGAAALLVGALVPDSIRAFSLDDRARFVFLAFALIALAIIAIIGLSGHAAIEAHRHPRGF